MSRTSNQSNSRTVEQAMYSSSYVVTVVHGQSAVMRSSREMQRHSRIDTESRRHA